MQNDTVPKTASLFTSTDQQRAILRNLRSALIQQYRPVLQQGAGPIRVMARLVTELEQRCQDMGIATDVIAAEICNRTIGDVNVRLITECVDEPGNSGDYRMLADELGVALPGENINGYIASGEAYRWLRAEMEAEERALLQQGIDLQVYELQAIGNTVLRERLAEQVRAWGMPVAHEQVYLSLGALDGLDKTLRGLAHVSRETSASPYGILFPEPGFGVPEWQARSHGYKIDRFQTEEAHQFKLTAPQLDRFLGTAEYCRVLYFTVSNNPSTFAYSSAELKVLYQVLQKYWSTGREIIILADLAYIGTGLPDDDFARMATFADPSVWPHCILVHSFSKTHTLTGQRFGWVTFGSSALAQQLGPAWSNSMASFPAEWQLRFMVYQRLISERSWLGDKLRAFYHLRRERLAAQLKKLDTDQKLFVEVYPGDDATVYVWCKLYPGEDAFTVFEKTGIAGVPGSGFGYSNEYVRFSVGVNPVPYPSMTTP